LVLPISSTAIVFFTGFSSIPVPDDYTATIML
jgi:hypothetical protein